MPSRPLAPACVCRLHTVAVRQAALVSDESTLEACLRRCAIQIDDLYLYLFSVELRFSKCTHCATESPDLVKCLTNIVSMCFPGNPRDLIGQGDEQLATSPLALIAIFQQLQHSVAGGSMFNHSIIHIY